MGFFKRFLLSTGARRAAILVSTCAAVSPPSGVIAATCVIELFSSQGCSSCPPADRLLAQIARKADIVAVTYSVDYWDYIGWKDTLASPLSSARQKAYAAVQGGARVYTPQAVIDGLADAIGGDREEIDEAIKSTKGIDGAMTLALRLSEVGGRIVIDVAAGNGGPAGVYAVRVLRSKTVHIGRGENAGRNVTYTNVVRAIHRIGDWTGASATFDVPNLVGEDEGYVFWVQRGSLDRPGAILGAAKTAGL